MHFGQNTAKRVSASLRSREAVACGPKHCQIRNRRKILSGKHVRHLGSSWELVELSRSCRKSWKAFKKAVKGRWEPFRRYVSVLRNLRSVLGRKRSLPTRSKAELWLFKVSNLKKCQMLNFPAGFPLPGSGWEAVWRRNRIQREILSEKHVRGVGKCCVLAEFSKESVLQSCHSASKNLWEIRKKRQIFFCPGKQVHRAGGIFALFSGT